MERRRFVNTYHNFHTAYAANGGGRLSTTVGDALLAYMKVFGYHHTRTQTPAQLTSSLAQVWEEIALQQEAQPIDVKLTPEEEKRRGLLAKMFAPGEDRQLKVAFIYDKTPLTSGWTYSHESGRLHVQRVFKGQIETTAYENAMAGDLGAVIEGAIAAGNTTIFTTSPRMLPASLRAAVEHPEVTILNCSLNKSHRYIRTYYARMYEAKFIVGAIAGTLAENDALGYVCDYPIYGQIAGSNAFALGAQMVDPRIKVYLEWSSVGGVDAATRRLRERGISLISSQDMAMLEGGERGAFGLYKVTETEKYNLVMPVWQWGVYYETIIRSILNNSFQTAYQESSRALNYYWGMSAGVEERFLSSHLPESTKKLAALLPEAICSGISDPFHGPLYRQDGVLVDGEDHTLSLEQIINMDWLVSNVVGEIPEYQDLTEEARATVDIVGVEPATEG